MQTRFNESLVQQVREGKLAIQCTSDHEKIDDLIKQIWPFGGNSNDVIGYSNYYFAYEKGYSCSDYIPPFPSRPVSDFFLPSAMRIEDVTDEQAIHCKTEEESFKILELLNDASYIFSNGERLDNRGWEKYGKNVCYHISPMKYVRYRDIDDFKNSDHEILPASLFLSPSTEVKERTWRVYRETLGALWRSADNPNEKSFYSTVAAAIFIGREFENYRDYTEDEVRQFMERHHECEPALAIFPDYSPSPIIPKGEFAWVRSTEKQEWLCRMSAGDGNFYQGQSETEIINKWDFVRKYEDRPF